MINTKYRLKCILFLLSLFLISSFTLYAKTPSSVQPSFNYSDHFPSILLKVDGSLWYVHTQSNTFKLDPITKDVVQVDGDFQNGIFVKKDGSAWSWTNLEYKGITPTKLLTDVQSVHYSNGIYGLLKNNGSLWIYGGLIDCSSPTQLTTDITSFALISDTIIFQKKDGSLWAYPELFMSSIYENKALSQITPVQLSKKVTSYEVSNNTLTFITPTKELWAWNAQGEPYKITTNVSECIYPMALKTDGTLYDLYDLEQTEIAPTPIDTHVVKLNPSLSSLDYAASTYIKKDGTLWTYIYNLKSSKKFETYQLSSTTSHLAFNGETGLVTLKDGSLWLFMGLNTLSNASPIPGFTLPSSWLGGGARLKGIRLTTDFINPSLDKIKTTTKLPDYEFLPLWITEKVYEGYDILEMNAFADESFSIKIREFIPQLDDGAFIYTLKGKGEKINHIEVDFPCDRKEDFADSTGANPYQDAKKAAINQLTGLAPYLSQMTKQSITLTASETDQLATAAIARTSSSIQKSGYIIKTLKPDEATFWGYARLAIDLPTSKSLSTNGKFLALPNETIERNYLAQLGFAKSNISRKYVNYPDFFTCTSLVGKRTPSQSTSLVSVEINHLQDRTTSYRATWSINQGYFQAHIKQCLDTIKSDVLKMNSLTKSTAQKKDLENVLAALKNWGDEYSVDSYYLGSQFTYPEDYTNLDQYDYFLLADPASKTDGTITIELNW